MKSKLPFNQEMFININEGRVSEGKKASALIDFVGEVLSYPLIIRLSGVFKKTMGILLTLSILVYKSGSADF
jgi:hypothetical protein